MAKTHNAVKQHLGKSAAMAGIDRDRDAPSRRAALSASGVGLTRMRTGMRCTTLTQLPLEILRRQDENSEPARAAMLSTVPKKNVRRGSIDVNFTGSPILTW